jgi:hypothetical protein
MTKGELIKALEPFSDKIEVFKVLPDRNGDFTNELPIVKLTYTLIGGVGQIVLE